MKKIIYFLYTLLIFSSCIEKKTISNKKDTTDKNDTLSTTLSENESDLLKFESTISYADFIVNIENANAKIDLNSHKLGQRFRTVIKDAYNNENALFAGHYSLATWGCGSPCQQSLLIDRRDGKIYDSPPASGGYEFQKNSRMLLINPPDSLGYYFKDCSYCRPEVYILNEETKKFERKI